jgi:hypothetical protein
MRTVFSKTLPMRFDPEPQVLSTCAAQLSRQYQGQHASTHVSQQPIEEKESQSHKGFIGRRRGNILAAQQYLERSLHIGTQPSKVRADSVQVEHGQPDHALIASRAFQVGFLVILAPDSDVAQLQSLQARKVIQLQLLFGNRFHIQDDSTGYGFDVGGRKTLDVFRCTAYLQSCC